MDHHDASAGWLVRSKNFHTLKRKILTTSDPYDTGFNNDISMESVDKKTNSESRIRNIRKQAQKFLQNRNDRKNNQSYSQMSRQ